MQTPEVIKDDLLGLEGMFLWANLTFCFIFGSFSTFFLILCYSNMYTLLLKHVSNDVCVARLQFILLSALLRCRSYTVQHICMCILPHLVFVSLLLCLVIILPSADDSFRSANGEFRELPPVELSNLPFILKVRFFLCSHENVIIWPPTRSHNIYLFYALVQCLLYHYDTSNMHSVQAKNIVCACLIMFCRSVILMNTF